MSGRASRQPSQSEASHALREVHLRALREEGIDKRPTDRLGAVKVAREVIQSPATGPWRASVRPVHRGAIVVAERRLGWLPFWRPMEEVGRVRFERGESVRPDLSFEESLERVRERARQRIGVLNNWSESTPKEDQDAATG